MEDRSICCRYHECIEETRLADDSGEKEKSSERWEVSQRKGYYYVNLDVAYGEFWPTFYLQRFVLEIPYISYILIFSDTSHNKQPQDIRILKQYIGNSCLCLLRTTIQLRFYFKIWVDWRSVSHVFSFLDQVEGRSLSATWYSLSRGRKKCLKNEFKYSLFLFFRHAI